MTNEQAYGYRDYHRRQNTQFQPGDRVTVGPSYRMGGTYSADGCEGDYVVISRLGSGSDYKVARGNNPNDCQDSWGYDYIVTAARLTHRL